MPHPERWHFITQPGPMFSPCWIWIHSKTRGGYGQLTGSKINGGPRMQKSHRVYYEFFDGCKVHDSLTIDHICRNPSCVNPAHLEPVPGRENTRRGIRIKLNERQIREIRRDFIPGTRGKGGSSNRVELGKKYGVDPATIRSVAIGLSWGWLN